MTAIVNRVEQSGLIAVDLADYSPKLSDIIGFDFAPVLWNELVLREKDFREFVKAHDWNLYQSKHVYVHCSVDAILPSWAYLLLTSQLVGIATTVTVGNLADAKQRAIELAIDELDLSRFENGKLIVKGCSDLPNPEAILNRFLWKVQPICSSIMFGEPCSTVPIYKKKK